MQEIYEGGVGTIGATTTARLHMVRVRRPKGEVFLRVTTHHIQGHIMDNDTSDVPGIEGNTAYSSSSASITHLQACTVFHYLL